MLACGLWHGASWTFVAWGAYHGALLVLGRLTKNGKLRIPGPIQVLLTFYLVHLGWVLFRASSFAKAWDVLRELHGAGVQGGGAGVADPRPLAFVLFALLL